MLVSKLIRDRVVKVYRGVRRGVD